MTDGVGWSKNLVFYLTSFINSPLKLIVFSPLSLWLLIFGGSIFSLYLYGIDDLKTRVAEGMSDIFFFQKKTFDFFEDWSINMCVHPWTWVMIKFHFLSYTFFCLPFKTKEWDKKFWEYQTRFRLLLLQCTNNMDGKSHVH